MAKKPTYKQGGKAGKREPISPEDAVISNYLMRKNQDKNFVQRAYNWQNSPSMQNPDGSHSTHLMSYDWMPNNYAAVYPEIVQENGQLQNIGTDAGRYADSTGQYIQVPMNKAEMFSSYGYKHAAGIPMKKQGGKIDYTTGANRPATRSHYTPQPIPQYSIGEQWVMEHPQQYIGQYQAPINQKSHEYLRNKMYQQEAEERANREFAQKLAPASELADKFLTAEMLISGTGAVKNLITGTKKLPYTGGFPITSVKNAKGNAPMPTITEVPQLTKEQQILQSFGLDPYKQRIRHNPKIDQWIREDAADMSEYILDEPMTNKVKSDMKTTLKMLQNAQERQKQYGISTPLDKQLIKDFDTREPANYLIQTYSQNKYGGQTNNDMKQNTNSLKDIKPFIYQLWKNGGMYWDGKEYKKGEANTGMQYEQGGLSQIHPFYYQMWEHGGQLPDEMKSGGIHIKPENRGKFNALKARTGKTTEELTHSKNPLTRKRAIFAQNAAKWHHQYGGQYEDGGEITEPGTAPAYYAPYLADTVLGAANVGLGALGTINQMNSARDVYRNSQQMGLSDNIPHMNTQAIKGDYNANSGAFRPQYQTPGSVGNYYPAMGQHGGYVRGQQYTVDDKEISRLRKLGYKFDLI